MINNTLILVVLHLYYLLSDLSNMLLSVNLGMKSNQTKMFAQVAKVQLSVTFSPLTVTGRNTMRPNFTSSDNHVNIYRSFQNWSTWNQNFVVFPVKKKTYGCWNCRYINSLVLSFSWVSAGGHSSASHPETTPADTNHHNVLSLFVYFDSCSGQTAAHISHCGAIVWQPQGP